MKQLDILISSNLDWTVVRPPELIDKPIDGTHKLSLDKDPGRKIPRREVANFILEQIEDTKYIHKMPSISY